jgi:hypothetical protein
MVQESRQLRVELRPAELERRSLCRLCDHLDRRIDQFDATRRPFVRDHAAFDLDHGLSEKFREGLPTRPLGEYHLSHAAAVP